MSEKAITPTTTDAPKAAKSEDVNKAKTDAAEEYQKTHEYTGDQLTSEEYDAAGRGEGYKPRAQVPGEDTLPQSSVLKPKEG